MLSSNDKDLIKQMFNHPGWALLKKELQEASAMYKLQAMMPDVEEHYRLILFAKAQGVDEVFTNSEEMVK